ncbi:MAG: glycosyltransferase family 1 protein [Methanothermobacter thermautotrophicus]|jgi:rhamnosyltransferase
MVKENYDITVTCEYEPPESRIDDYKGVKLIYFPLKPPENYFLRKFYENLSDIYFLLKLSRRFDIIYFLGIEVGLFLFIPKILNRNLMLMVNIDGVMWKRTKFNILERWLLKLNHIFATIFADKIVIDAENMGNYVSESRRKKTVFIPYGVEEIEEVSWDPRKLKALSDRNPLIEKIKRNDYWLVVARLEPENNIHVIIEGFLKSNSTRPLVIVGDPTSEKYKRSMEKLLKKYQSKNVLMIGSIYDSDILNMLRQNCFVYIHGHSVGGTNPSILEAAISKNIILAHDNEFNREVCGDFAIYFKDSDDLKDKLELLEEDPEAYKLKEKLQDRVKKRYSWDKIVNKYMLAFNI